MPFRASGVQLGTTDDISTMVTAVLCSSRRGEGERGTHGTTTRVSPRAFSRRRPSGARSGSRGSVGATSSSPPLESSQRVSRERRSESRRGFAGECRERPGPSVSNQSSYCKFCALKSISRLNRTCRIMKNEHPGEGVENNRSKLARGGTAQARLDADAMSDGTWSPARAHSLGSRSRRDATLADEPIPGPRSSRPLVHFSRGSPRRKRRRLLLGSRPPSPLRLPRPAP